MRKGLCMKAGRLLLAGGVMALSFGIRVFAAGTPIPSVRVTFTDCYDAGEENTRVLEPEVTVSDNRYSVESVTYSKKFDEPESDKEGRAVPGKKVTATVTLTAEDGYQFDSGYGKSGCRVYGADYVSASVKSADTMVVKAEYTPVAKLGQPETAGWGDSTKRRAVWKKVNHASAYQLRLYAEGAMVRTLTVYVNNVDLTPYMNKEVDYYYEVKAIPKDSGERGYLREGETVSSDSTLIDNLGETGGSWKNYREGKRYRDENGNYVSNSWKMIGGRWYYFNNDGYVATGWTYINGRWYCLNDSGEMQTGWVINNDKWYYLNPNGDMATGWVEAQPSCWYYLDSSGVMQTGWVSVGGRWYYLDVTGLMAVNTTIDGHMIGADGARIQ